MLLQRRSVRTLFEGGVEVIPNGDIAAIVNVDRRLNKGFLADIAPNRLQHRFSVCNQGVGCRIVWKVGVCICSRTSKHGIARRQAPAQRHCTIHKVNVVRYRQGGCRYHHSLDARDSSHIRRTIAYYFRVPAYSMILGVFLRDCHFHANSRDTA